MSGMTTQPATSRTTMALGVSLVGLVLFIVAIMIAQEENDWLWPVAGLIGGIGAVLGWMAGKPRPQSKALAAVVIGGLVFLVVLGWWIVATITGNG